MRHKGPSSRVNPRSSARSCVEPRSPKRSGERYPREREHAHRERNRRNRRGSGDRRGAVTRTRRARDRASHDIGSSQHSHRSFSRRRHGMRARRGDVDVPSTCFFAHPRARFHTPGNGAAWIDRFRRETARATARGSPPSTPPPGLTDPRHSTDRNTPTAQMQMDRDPGSGARGSAAAKTKGKRSQAVSAPPRRRRRGGRLAAAALRRRRRARERRRREHQSGSAHPGSFFTAGDPLGHEFGDAMQQGSPTLLSALKGSSLRAGVWADFSGAFKEDNMSLLGDFKNAAARFSMHPPGVWTV